MPQTTTIKMWACAKFCSSILTVLHFLADKLWGFATFSLLKLPLFCLWPFPLYHLQDQYAFCSRSDYFSPCQLTLTSPVIPPSTFNVIFSFSLLITCTHLKSVEYLSFNHPLCQRHIHKHAHTVRAHYYFKVTILNIFMKSNHFLIRLMVSIFSALDIPCTVY